MSGGVITNVVWVLILKRTYNLKYYIFYKFGYHFGFRVLDFKKNISKPSGRIRF
jgi:hypothetical protein